MKTSDLFEKEISYISNKILRDIVRDTLNSAPECIQTIPASSSRRHHPKADQGEGGLVRHIRTVTAIAKSMIDTEIFGNIALSKYHLIDNTIKNDYADAAIAACILHDCMKPDNTPEHRTVFDHPLRASVLFKEVSNRYITEENKIYMDFIVPLISGCIESHMGQWTTASYAKGIVLPKPRRGIEKFVHICDFIASREFIDFNFEVYYGAKTEDKDKTE